MRIGVPKEVKNNENRIAMTPAGVVNLEVHGHDVFIQSGAGLGSGFTDEDYSAAGAKIVETADEAWAQEMVMKVKRTRPGRVPLFPGRTDSVHLSASSA